MSVDRQAALFWMGKLRHNQHQQAESRQDDMEPSACALVSFQAQEVLFLRPQTAEGKGSNELWWPDLRE